MPKRESNWLKGVGFDWPKEEAACDIYLKQLTREGQRTDEPVSIVEVAAACIYEYTREIVYLQYFNYEGSFLQFLERDPFFAIAGCWPEDPKSGRVIPKSSWAFCDDGTRRTVMEAIVNGYEALPRLDSPNIWVHFAVGTFEKFREEALRLHDAAGVPGAEMPDEDALSPSIPARGSTPYGEHVIFTIDYRESKDRLQKSFAAWLDAHNAQFDAHQLKLNGALFRNRLRDLAVLRLWREYGSKIPEGKSLPGNESSLSESRTRARDFRAKLPGTRFRNIRELERDFTAET